MMGAWLVLVHLSAKRFNIRLFLVNLLSNTNMLKPTSFLYKGSSSTMFFNEPKVPAGPDIHEIIQMAYGGVCFSTLNPCKGTHDLQVFRWLKSLIYTTLQHCLIQVVPLWQRLDNPCWNTPNIPPSTPAYHIHHMPTALFNECQLRPELSVHWKT